MHTVLIIVENLSVPFDTRVWKQALALKDNGYNVLVLCPQGQGFTQSFEMIEGVAIYRHPVLPQGRGVFGFLGEYLLAMFWETLFTWRIFFKHQFRVLQGCNPPDNIFLLSLPFRLFGVKYIFDHHDLCPEMYEAKFQRRDVLYWAQRCLERLTFMTCHVSMATNETYRELALSRGKMNPDKVFVVRNGPEPDSFVSPSAKRENPLDDRFVVGYVGMIGAVEEADLVVALAEELRRRGRGDVRFLCVGGGPGLEAVQELSRQKRVDDCITFTGQVSHEQVRRLLSTAHVCVNLDRPTKQNESSTMIKIMEYMALKKPIVQFDVKEGRVSAGSASLYAQKDDIVDFADKLVWLLDNPEDRERMGELGRRRIEDELAWKYSVPNLLAAYEKALS